MSISDSLMNANSGAFTSKRSLLNITSGVDYDELEKGEFNYLRQIREDISYFLNNFSKDVNTPLIKKKQKSRILRCMCNDLLMMQDWHHSLLLYNEKKGIAANINLSNEIKQKDLEFSDEKHNLMKRIEDKRNRIKNIEGMESSKNDAELDVLRALLRAKHAESQNLKNEYDNVLRKRLEEKAKFDEWKAMSDKYNMIQEKISAMRSSKMQKNEINPLYSNGMRTSRFKRSSEIKKTPMSARTGNLKLEKLQLRLN